MLPTHRRGTPHVLVAAAFAASWFAETLRAQDSQDSGSPLEEVVVTAQKREERLQDVPLSVTALSGDQLVSLKLNSGSDIAKYTPNLRISNAGNEDQPKISIRGLSQFDFNLNASSPTGVFYDEVYIASQFLGGPQIYDMQRLEVLRGPQGTLFGKNTVGGAVDYITRAPTFEGDTHAYLSGEAGSNSYYRAEGATSVHPSKENSRPGSPSMLRKATAGSKT
jgi:iron complex outermembrane receptor protein